MTEVVNVQDAKAHLSQLIARAEAGEDVVIGRAHKPAVRLVRIDTATPRRTFGTMPSLSVPSDFDAPLPDDDLAEWDG
ncbi:type II toxin-antitoxin system Phd/YefM family antitoxin [Cellulomonas pakistanensis]|uniref:Antitoxin n=1 Tax=Cellulomonas pakistanensis TaxID=992287 RepID=A0A919P5G3_9CELL|nr:type II toxin-antitoxin system prevent-host-death family antitoxin [Cellulomonas pakistanensis]GIG34694.1 antitoxin [Cellulomonas pakistanensis]